MPYFNGIDYVILILLFFSVVIGLVRGFIKEVISLVTWVAAFTVSMLYAVDFAALFSSSTHTSAANLPESVSMVEVVISYLVLFIGTLLIGSIIKYIVNRVVEGVGLSGVNRFFGALFGLARGCVIILIAMFFIDFTALAAQGLWKNSKMVEIFAPSEKWVAQMVQPYVKVIAEKMKKTARKLKNQEDISDIIQMKPTIKVPVINIPVPTPASSAAVPVTTLPAAP